MEVRQRDLTRSFDYWNRAQRLIPNGTQTLSKGPDQFVRGIYPIYLERGQGCHVFDVDGNEYIDYPMSLGPVILGHAYPATVEAIQRQLERGITFTLMHPLEVELAELICQCVPCAEMVRYAKNGSDATSAAIRVARAHTGREKVAHCGYHGWQDWYAIATPRDRGIPRALKDLIFTFKYNQIETLERIFAEQPGQVAAVILEQGAENPQDDFLGRVKELTHRHGAVLIFDEIVTGFRYALGGIQEYFGVVPDLACFGKAIANGMPLSVLVGRKEIMRTCEEVFFSMTFGGEALSLAAAVATIREIREKEVIPYLWKMGRRWKEEFNGMARELGVNVECIGQGPRTSFVFRDGTGEESLEMRGLFLQETVKRGILFGGPIFMTYSHAQQDLDRTLEACEDALKILRRALNEGDILRYMEGEVPQVVFRRIQN